MSELAWTVGRDRRKEARLHRRWNILQMAIGAVLALLARRLAERAWAVMTGEVPPILGHAGEPARDLPGTDSEEADRAAKEKAQRERAAATQAENVKSVTELRLTPC